mgnify:CR=1 FL=1
MSLLLRGSFLPCRRSSGEGGTEQVKRSRRRRRVVDPLSPFSSHSFTTSGVRAAQLLQSPLCFPRTTSPTANPSRKAQEQPEQLLSSPSPSLNFSPALMFTLPTPENDGWKSPSPLPRSFLPPEKDETATRPATSSEVPVELDRTARKEALLKAMRRTSSLSALSTALGCAFFVLRGRKARG